MKINETRAMLPAQDIERARKFYEEKVGLKPSQVMPDGGAVYAIGTSGFLLFPSSGKASGDHTQIGFEVDDVLATANELKKNGVVLEEYDFPGVKSEGGVVSMGDEKAAWFKDSEGNLIALMATASVQARMAGGNGDARGSY